MRPANAPYMVVFNDDDAIEHAESQYNDAYAKPTALPITVSINVIFIPVH